MNVFCYAMIARDVTVNFEPGEYMRKIIFSVRDISGSEEKFRYLPMGSQTHDPLVTCPDSLPLSYRRLVGAKATKLGLCDKHPAYC